MAAVGFAGASLIGGIAQQARELIGARALQGYSLRCRPLRPLPS
ncbi:hypothetical protein [Arthrobacter sp. TE12232]